MNTRATLILAIIIILLSLGLLNPFDWWMPSTLEMSFIVILALIGFAYAAFFWKERPRDEREEHVQRKAGRSAFLAGILIGITGIIVQGLQHALDAWLIATVAVMLLAKIIATLQQEK
ncbi:MAG: hypothetical protein H6760_02745 [Candidatus Nomurabacteria bacterium]|nr:MAG: hypothetical protein H6760_02745 [Candidatus Nomurabacteria bacterium]